MTVSPAQLSPLDEERFDIRTAKAQVATVDEVTSTLDFCRQQSVRLLIARCPADRWAAAHALEVAGSRLMDVLVYFKRDLQKTSFPEAAGATTVRTASPQDAEVIAAIARESFKGYQGHYHADPRLDRTACDEVYASWARRSCLSREVAHEVLVATHETELLGFITLRRNSPTEGEVCLNAVTPAAQGQGIYRTLMIHALTWCRDRGCRQVIVSTQITNIAVQKVWARVGFEPDRSYLTFHCWFDS